MTLLPEKVSAFLHNQKVKGLKRKIHDLSCLMNDLDSEARCDPERSVEYQDHVEEVRERMELFTAELEILSAGNQEKKIA